MQHSLLYKIWAALPETAQKRVVSAANTPLFNEREEVVRLFDFLEKNRANKKKTPDLAKETAFQYIYAHAPATAKKAKATYDDNKMRRLLGYGLEVLRKTLAWEYWKEDTPNLDLNACRALKKMGLEAHFERELHRAEGNLESESPRSDDYFFRKYLLEAERWEMFRQSQRNNAANVQTQNISFAAFVAINSLRQGCTVAAHQTHTNVTASIPFLQETLRLAADGVFDGMPAVSAWRAGYLALTESDNEEPFQRLKRHIERDADLFPDADLRDLYILAINVCIRRINLNDARYFREAFDLYRGGLANKVLLENGHLSKFTYRNILRTALGLKEWDWAFQYLHECREMLAPKDRDNIFRYNLATFYYRKNDHVKTLEILRHVEMHDMLEHFDCRRMLLRSYYALGEWDSLAYLLDSFGAYLQRHKEGGYHREMYRNLVRFTKQLMALPTHSKAKRQKLAEDIQKTQYVAEREWLLEVAKG